MVGRVGEFRLGGAAQEVGAGGRARFLVDRVRDGGGDGAEVAAEPMLGLLALLAAPGEEPEEDEADDEAGEEADEDGHGGVVAAVAGGGGGCCCCLAGCG